MSIFSRRQFFQVAGAVGAGSVLPYLAVNAANSQSSAEADILKIFARLPGQKAMKIETVKNNTPWQVALNPDLPLFCASSFKVYVLTEFLRQMETGKVKLTDKLVVSDELRSLSSPVFLELSGNTTALNALEAMIMQSDNTATDLILNLVTPQAVRMFIKEIGLDQTRIPNSTRTFFSCVTGSNNCIDLGWSGLTQALNSKQAVSTRKIINEQQTMVGSPANFVSFYNRALKGQFFQKPETLIEFKRILALPSVLTQFIPDGAFGYVKGGSIEFASQYALSLAGGIRFPSDRWAYYSFLINWEDQMSGQLIKVQTYLAEAIFEILTIVNKATA